MKVARSRKYKHQIMANQGFGEVKIIAVGEKRLSRKQLATMTISEAMKLHNKGLAVTAM